ncbi:MAG: serine/threonine-protein kinase [Candidatus Margulisiibacteriota bacterium]
MTTVTNISNKFPSTLIRGLNFAGKFRITGVLGEGGIARVFRARHIDDNREVALKVFPQENRAIAASEQTALLKALGNPHMVQLYTSGTCELEGQQLFYLEMECIEGRDLAHLLMNASHRFTMGRSLEIALQICRGLSAGDFVHGDIKPSNIMVWNGSLKMLDPVARMEGMFAGTPKYMSPEQLRGETPDKLSDMYSLGLVLYEMIFNQPPFEVEDEDILEQCVQYSAVRKKDLAIKDDRLPLQMKSLMENMLKAEKEQRYQSFSEIVKEIETIQQQIPGLLSEWIAIEALAEEREDPPTVSLRRHSPV